MGYQIQYGQTMKKLMIREQQRTYKNTPAIKWILMCLVLLLIAFLGNSGYLDFMIPGNKEVTTAAFELMITNVREGERVANAFTGFCLEILYNAQSIN